MIYFFKYLTLIRFLKFINAPEEVPKLGTTRRENCIFSKYILIIYFTYIFE